MWKNTKKGIRNHPKSTTWNWRHDIVQNSLSIPLKHHLPRLFMYFLTFCRRTLNRNETLLNLHVETLLRPQPGETTWRADKPGSYRCDVTTACKGSAEEGGGISCSRSLSTLRFLDNSRLPRWLSGKESTYNAGEAGSIPGKIPWRRK